MWDRRYGNYPTLFFFFFFFFCCLFGAVKVVKNADIDKYKYSGYDTGFDRHELFKELIDLVRM